MPKEKRKTNKAESAFLPIDAIKLAEEWARAKVFFGDSSGKFSRKTSGLEHSFIKSSNGIILMLANNKEGEIKDDKGYVIQFSSNVIGEGGFGRVKYAKDEKGALYAVKSLEQFDPEWVKREAKINEKLGYGFAEIIEHPESKRQKIYIVMKYLGEPLCEFLEKGHITTLNDRLDLVIQAGIELYHINKNGYTHRNVSLQNMIVDDQNTLHIIDYGDMGANKDNRDVRALIDLSKTSLLPELSDPLRAYMNSHKQEVTSLYLAAAFILYQSKGASLTLSDLEVLTENIGEQENLISNFKYERHRTLQATQAIVAAPESYELLLSSEEKLLATREMMQKFKVSIPHQAPAPDENITENDKKDDYLPVKIPKN